MVFLVERLPAWSKAWVRRALLVTNIALIAYAVASAEGDGSGLDVAQYWMALTGVMSQCYLFWCLLRRPRTAASHLSMQCLGILSVCHVTRFFGASRWSLEIMDLPFPPVLASLSVLNAGLAAWFRRSIVSSDEDPAIAMCAVPYGAEFVRVLQGPVLASLCQRPFMSFLWSSIEHAVLPAAALILSLVVECIFAFNLGHAGWYYWIAGWHQALETLALLPQFRVLLALRTQVDGDAVAVPPDLAYWLTCMAVGHLLAFITAITDSLVPQGKGRQAFVFGCGEGFNAAILGELLFAHFRAKWRGDKQLVLPS